MERIVLRHLSGSKANQVEEFPLSHFSELTIGRDPSATVKYDPDRDDLVGRQHARITQDPADPTQFTISDLSSRNGTYVNKQRIIGSARITPGDVVQFGPGGPEFQFDLEPRPANMVKPTRVGDSPAFGGPPPTRTGPGSVAPTMPSAMSGGMGMSGGMQGMPPQGMGSMPGGMGPGGMGMSGGMTDGRVGRATVERMIAQNKTDSKKYVILAVVGLVVIVAAVAVGLLLWNRAQAAKNSEEAKAANEKLGSQISDINGKIAPMSPADVTSNFADSTVFVQVSWALIESDNHNPLFFKYFSNRFKDKDGNEHALIPDNRAFVAAYKVVPGQEGNVIEPWLTTDTGGAVLPVGFPIVGSGFVVSNDGYIITNKHVAAPWEVYYQFRDFAFPGVLFDQNGNLVTGNDGAPVLVNQQQLGKWVPANTQQFGASELGNPRVQGRNETLDITFAKTELRRPAQVKAISDRHDVALIKVDIPEPLKKVELNDNYDTIKPGDQAIVLGYPAGSPALVGVIGSKAKTSWYQDFQLGVIPNPTLSVGYISRILRSQEGTGGKDTVVSSFGDIYQLTINSTGGGNSGGPVFDDHGRVIAIYSYGIGLDFQASGAVPIKFAKELMSPEKVVK